MSRLNCSNIFQMNSTSKLVLILISVSIVLSVPVEVSKYFYTLLFHKHDTVKSGWSSVYIIISKKHIVFLSPKIDFVLVATSADNDETLHHEACHLGLHCLPKYMFRGFSVLKESNVYTPNTVLKSKTVRLCIWSRSDSCN